MRVVAPPTGFVTAQGIKVVQVRLKQYREVLSIADVSPSSPSIVRRSRMTHRSRADQHLFNAQRTRLEVSPPSSSKP